MPDHEINTAGKAGAAMATPAKTLSALLQRTSIEDHEEVLKACNASLKQSKGDLELQHIKIVALLKLDRYDDALRVLEEGGDRLKQRVPTESAYALYKVGEFEEAKNVAKRISDERGARHVEAQAVCIPCPKRETGLVLTSDGSHIGQRISRMLQHFTRTWLAVRRPSRMKWMTLGSTAGPRMPSWSGRGKGVWCRRRSLEGRTWKLSRQRIMRLVARLLEASLVKGRCC